MTLCGTEERKSISMKKCKILVIEGPDKMGKNTQSTMLLLALNTPPDVKPVFGQTKACLVEVPTRGFTYKLIYWMLSNSLAKRLPNTFQFVQFMNKYSFQLFKLPKLLKENDYVILDRWSLSGLVYGAATGVNLRFNAWLFSKMKYPDLTLVMHGSSFRRKSEDDDSYESDNDLQKRVKDLYYTQATTLPAHELVDNQGTPEEVHNRIICIMMHFGTLPGVFGLTQ